MFYFIGTLTDFMDFLVNPIIEISNINIKWSRLLVEHKRKVILTEAARLQFTSRSNKAAVTRELSKESLENIRVGFNYASIVIRNCFGFFFTTFCDWFKKLAPPAQPIRCKTKTNHDLVTHVFPRLLPVTCICFEFSLVHCVVYVCCD